jgi:hypothetical protein
MSEKDRADTEPAHGVAPKPRPVTPSSMTRRPEGLAFDVAEDTDLPGVPAGDPTPRHPGAARTQQRVREAGGGVGLAVPGSPDLGEQKPDEKADKG